MAKVLVVDDHAPNRELIVDLLRHRGHESVEAADGVEALDAVRGSHPDLVICDVLMPNMDGYEFVRQLRADSAIAATEVVFYTATFLEQEARNLALSCGVSQVLLKPCEAEHALAVIDRALAHAGPPAPVADAAGFERQHRQLLADKLVQKSDQLAQTSDQLTQKADQLERANLRLAALTELNLQLASESDPDALLEKVCRGARTLIGARYAVLGVKDMAHAVLTRVTTSGMADSEAAPVKQLQVDVGLPRRVMEERVARRIFNPGGDPAAAGLSGAYPPVHSALIVPVGSLTRVHGWILLIDKLGADSFDADDERLLGIHAAQAGRIYESGSLYRQLQVNTDRLRAEIAERRAAAEKLHESELRFRQLAENIREVFFLTGAEPSQLLYVSPAYAQVWGRSTASLRCAPQHDVGTIHPDDRARVQSLQQQADAAAPFDYEYRIVRPDGGVRWIGTRGFPIRDAAGKVYRIAGIAEDITERVRLAAELQERAAGLAHAQAVAHLAHVITRPDGSFESWSDSLPVLAGVTPVDLPPTTRAWLARVHPDDQALFRATCIRAAAQGVKVQVDYRLCRDTRWIHVHQEIEPLGDLDRPGRWFSTLQDVTGQKLVEQRIAHLNRVHAVLSGINALIVRVRSRDELFREACRIAVEVGEYKLAWIGTVDAATGQGRIVAWHGADDDFAVTVRLSVHADAPTRDRPANRAMRLMRPVLSNDIPADATLDAPVRDALLGLGLRSQACFPLLVDGRSIGVLTLCSQELDTFDDQETALLGELADDIAFAFDHLHKAERLDHLAYYDALTGLANASLLNQHLAQGIAAAAAEGQLLALALVDLERFRTFNHSLGRHGGDALLKQVAARMSEGLDARARLARLDADHFALLLHDVRDAALVGRQLAEQYRRWFEPPQVIAGHELRVAARVGIALYPGDGEDAETLLRHAEAAVRKAKRGAERVVFFDARMAESVAGELALEEQLRRALERGEFVLHYQPKVDLETRRLLGVEALIRWNSPERGLVAPDRFIPLLEQTGLIVEVGAWVLRQAVADHAAWRDMQLAAPRIAVNVSAVQLREPDFLARVERALDAGEHPHGIDFELTESVIMEDVQANIGKLQALNELGIELAIDDFGTGYSSLAYLARLPAQIVKIDRAFVSTMLDDPNHMSLISTVISLAHSLRMKSVAEGVETPEQAKLLRLLRCDQMQGFLVCRPLPFDAMTDFIQAGAQGR
ncbi:EAL domain-containing protein [Aquincola sp. S2]|uniref:EAL domain-containing protein n=1 Tax=Pseudaquabacterium terrae TaxID=2732868 RepID=A0ABX2ERF8_9BURK|nr:EAL domain-containing protein [Aquabacterium terrae]NRF71096.1 EAL domain-containing protein [Aquabacterium terrae]